MGHSADDEIADVLARASAHALKYRESLPTRHQGRTATYEAMLDAFRGDLPEVGQPGPEIIDDLARRAEPGLITMAGPRFYGWVIGGSHPVGIAADWMVSAWGQNNGNHLMVPAASAAEEVAAGWLLDLADLPRDASVGFVTGATVANFVGLSSGRGAVLRKAGWDAEADGLFGAPPITVIVGEDAHTTVFSALRFIGLGHNRVQRVRTDSNGAMIASEAVRMINAASGPTIVIAQAGQLNTGAFDPFPEITAAAKDKGAWVHVDGAFGLWARACPDTAHLAAGIENCDSWATDGHKWLQTPYDCGFAIVRDADAHRRAMTTAASYLPEEARDERDPSHLAPELSRRARGFVTWAVLRALGRSGVAEMVGRHCQLAKSIAERIAAEPGITVANDVVLNQVICRFGDDRGLEAADALTEATIQRIQKDGRCFAGGARWRGAWMMRMSVINYATSEADADETVAAITDAWRAVQSSQGGV